MVRRGPRSGLYSIVAIHSTVRGPALGGCRMWTYHDARAAVRDALRLSRAMTAKSAVADLPLGGGKGVVMLPSAGPPLDPDRRRAALLDFGDTVDSLGGRYVTAEDVGTSDADMEVIAERTEHVAGLSLERGGSGDPSASTALGVAAAIRVTGERAWGSPSLAGRRIAVLGVGHVGARLARLLAEEGARVVALSDSNGAIVNSYGLDVHPAITHKSEHGVLAGLPGGEEATNEELLELECDVLVPAALEQAISADNAARIRAHMVCEAANSPTTPGADELLEDRGIVVLPDVLANAGGVVVSYFEWVQGLQEYFWKEYEVNAKLNDIVVRAFEETWSTRERFGTSMRTAAYGLAVQRVAEATTTRGLYP